MILKKYFNVIDFEYVVYDYGSFESLQISSKNRDAHRSLCEYIC